MAKALLFDLNGTMIDDMEYHIQVWERILNKELGTYIELSEVKRQMYGTSKEILERIFGTDHFNSKQIEIISENKEREYRAVYKPYIKPTPGLLEFLNLLGSKKYLAGIGTATVLPNVEFILDALKIQEVFQGVVTAEDVMHSKPDPEVYISLAKKLGVFPKECIVFEDAPQGAIAARNAGMECIIVNTLFEHSDFEAIDNILFFVDDFCDPRLLTLLS